jgi:alpha-tubulin suppressor-like RCC1 family protein
MKKRVFAISAVCLILLMMFSLTCCTLENETNGKTKIVTVSAGNSHAMALDDKGQLWAWGDNYYGQVGDGNISTYFDPIYDDSGDDEYSELLNGRVRNIDNDVYTPKYIMSNVKEVYARGDSSFVITNDNKLYAWGRNDYGQLGDGTTDNKSTPTYIADNVIFLDSSSSLTTIMLKTDQSLWVAGIRFGQSGPDVEYHETPVLLCENVKKVSFDGNSYKGLLILKEDGNLVSYTTEDVYGYKYIFKDLNGLHDVVDLSAAGQQVYILDKNGNVHGWGANTSEGSLGAGRTEHWIDKPIFIASDIKKILQGCMFIKNDGTLLIWGTVWTTEDYRNIRGVDGGGGLTGELIVYGIKPVSILNNIAMADGRGTHFIAVDKDGNVYTWGENFYGQLGNGTSSDQTTPKQIVFP